MARVRTVAIVLFFSGLFTNLFTGLMTSSAQAQLRGYAAPSNAREPARVGLLGGLREAREERFRREAQAASAAARAAAPRPATPPATAPQANALSAARNPYATAPNNTNPNLYNAANNNLLRRQPPASNVDPAARASNVGRTANYGSTNPQSAYLPPQVRAPNLANPAINNSARNNSALNNANNNGYQPTFVAPASANTFIPSPMRYEGPGVTIRLPAGSRGVVNYLLDDVENNAIRPGEQQVLDDKGSYVVRYSRGVTPDGRTFGESRYTVTEGTYRFELTSTGWELYRESDSTSQPLPPNRLDMELADRSFTEVPSPLSREVTNESLATELPRPSENASEPTESNTEGSTSSQSSEESPSTTEELPAPRPRSILEK